MTNPNPPADPRLPARLDGWKEIAAYFRKGVRTVQRWEKELGLPVRRMGTGRGEVVFAMRSELAAWHAAVLKRDELAARAGEEEPERPAAERHEPPAADGLIAPARTRSPLATWLPSVGLLVGIALVAFYAWSVAHPTQPAAARVQDGVLRVFDASGRPIWEHRFDPPLDPSPEAEAMRRRYPSSLIEDIDDDGRNEVLFINNAEAPGPASGLYCFDHRGRERFAHTPRHHVTYGRMPANGPWRPLLVRVFRGSDGRKAIWFASNDTDQFPTFVEKLDPAGRTRGVFWHPGIVEQVRPWRYQGRAVMLIAGANNDFHGASLAVVDEADPTGTGPARQDHYTCRGCPSRPPLAFVVFPATDLEILQSSTAGVSNIWGDDQGHLTIQLYHASAFPGMAAMEGTTRYHLDASLQPLSGEHQPGFRVLHDELRRNGRLDHDFGAADEASLFPVYRWNGAGFDQLWPAGESGQ